MYMKRAWRRLRRLTWQLFIPAWAKRLGIDLADTVHFDGWPILDRAPDSAISLGQGAKLCSVSGLTALGVNHPVILRTLRPGAELAIGSNVGISGGAICAAISVRIGENSLIGANVTITDTDFHPIEPNGRRYASLDAAKAAPVSIGSNVFLGTGVIVLKGVSIGDNSVIGAGSVVSKDIPANVVAAGHPARVIANLDPGGAKHPSPQLQLSVPSEH